ncbi:MAG: tRNA lysidine(34) synthetase TilS [Thermodesulfobacteriota bacterium]
MPRLQNLPPKQAHLCLEIDRFVGNELGVDFHGNRLLLAVSGGVDSVALLAWAAAMRHKWQAHLHCAHLDHGLRPESPSERARVHALCEQLRIPCVSGRSLTPCYARRNNLGNEEAGRILRYRYLHGVARRQGCDYLLTAHHANDLAEDNLMRLLRGAGWPALAGMPAWDPNRRLIRPFLLTPKKRLQALVEAAGLSWQEDTSNADPAYQRNRIRHQILPLLLKENPHFLETLAQTWRQAQADSALFDQLLAEARQTEERTPRGRLAPRATLESLPPALRARWYKAILDQIGPGQAVSENISRLDALFREKKSGKMVQFPGDKQATVTREGIIFGWKRD